MSLAAGQSAAQVAGTGTIVSIGGPVGGTDTFVPIKEVTDFKNPDMIEVEKSVFGSTADILAHDAVNDGHGNTIITDPQGNVLERVDRGIGKTDFLKLLGKLNPSAAPLMP